MHSIICYLTCLRKSKIANSDLKTQFEISGLLKCFTLEQVQCGLLAFLCRGTGTQSAPRLFLPFFWISSNWKPVCSFPKMGNQSSYTVTYQPYLLSQQEWSHWSALKQEAKFNIHIINKISFYSHSNYIVSKCRTLFVSLGYGMLYGKLNARLNFKWVAGYLSLLWLLYYLYWIKWATNGLNRTLLSKEGLATHTQVV